MKTFSSIFNLFISRFPKAAAGCIVVFCLVNVAACERRPLEELDMSTDIEVAVMTKAILNVSMGVYNDKISVPSIHPEVMHVVFYDHDSDRLVTEAYISEREETEDGRYVFSGDIHIAPGTYKMIVHNFGTETTVIRDYETWSLATAQTTPVNENIMNAYRKYKMKAEEEEAVVYEPDHLLVYVNENEVIPVHAGDHVIEAEATTVVDSYYLQIKVEGLEYVSSANAYLSGMASGNLLNSRRPVHDPQSTLFFTLQKSDDNGVPVICNVFNTFGHIPDSSNRLEVVFNIQTRDGRSVQRTFDISDVFETREAVEKHWLLIDETITIDPPENPGPGEGGGGMDPSVEDWEDENHDIKI